MTLPTVYVQLKAPVTLLACIFLHRSKRKIKILRFTFARQVLHLHRHGETDFSDSDSAEWADCSFKSPSNFKSSILSLDFFDYQTPTV